MVVKVRTSGPGALGPRAGKPRSAHVSQSERAMIDAQPNALAL